MVSLHCRVVVIIMAILKVITLMAKDIKNGQTERHILVNTKWDRKKDMGYINGLEAKDMKGIGKKMSNMEWVQFIIKNG